MARKTTTSSMVIQRWKDKTYKRLNVYLRKEDDAEIIKWLDKHKDIRITDVFREGARKIMDEYESKKP